MARLLIGKEWYEGVSSTAYWEAEFENVLLRRADVLFPEYFMVEFKTEVQGDSDIGKPDFALIEKKYRIWWVVEVELAHHSFAGHVLPQVDTFASGRYG